MDLLVTPPPSPPDQSQTVEDGCALSRRSKSWKVAEEIVESERLYVKALDEVVQGYKTQLMDYIRFCSLPLAVEDVIVLFGNIEDALQFNRNFLAELEECCLDPEKIARKFVDNANGFYIYTVYCTNYPRAVAVLSSCQDKPQITEFFKACQKKVKHSLPLGAFLLKPVQRILKYHLLMRDLVSSIQKETRKSMSILETALFTMSTIAADINEMKRKHEAAIHIQEIQAQLLGWDHDDLSLCGNLLLEGNLHIRGARGERTVYLFDRSLLVVKRKGEHLVYKGSIPTNKMTLTDLIIGEPLDFRVSELDNLSNAFTFRPATVSVKSQWAGAIKELMLAFYDKQEEQEGKLKRRIATRKRKGGSNSSQTSISSVKVQLNQTGSESSPEPQSGAATSEEVLISPRQSCESTPSGSKKTKMTIAVGGEDTQQVDVIESAPVELTPKLKTRYVEKKVETEADEEEMFSDEDDVATSSFQLKLNVGTAVSVGGPAGSQETVREINASVYQSTRKGKDGAGEEESPVQVESIEMQESAPVLLQFDDEMKKGGDSSDGGGREGEGEGVAVMEELPVEEAEWGFSLEEMKSEEEEAVTVSGEGEESEKMTDLSDERLTEEKPVEAESESEESEKKTEGDSNAIDEEPLAMADEDQPNEKEHEEISDVNHEPFADESAAVLKEKPMEASIPSKSKAEEEEEGVSQPTEESEGRPDKKAEEETRVKPGLQSYAQVAKTLLSVTEEPKKNQPKVASKVSQPKKEEKGREKGISPIPSSSSEQVVSPSSAPHKKDKDFEFQVKTSKKSKGGKPPSQFKVKQDQSKAKSGSPKGAHVKEEKPQTKAEKEKPSPKIQTEKVSPKPAGPKKDAQKKTWPRRRGLKKGTMPEEEEEELMESSSRCCPFLHIVLVIIALLIAIAFSLISSYPLHIKVGLVALPFAALLLFVCAGDRRRPRVISS